MTKDEIISLIRESMRGQFHPLTVDKVVAAVEKRLEVESD